MAAAAEADLADEIVAEIAVQSLCIRQFATNAGSPARFLLSQLAASQCIAMFVLEARRKPEIIEGETDFRKKVLIVTKLLLKLTMMR